MSEHCDSPHCPARPWYDHSRHCASSYHALYFAHRGRNKECPVMKPRRIFACTAFITLLAFGSATRALADTQSASPTASPASQRTSLPSSASASDLLSQAQADIAAGHNSSARDELRRAASIDPGNLQI